MKLVYLTWLIIIFHSVTAVAQQTELEQLLDLGKEFQQLNQREQPIRAELDEMRLYGDPWSGPLRVKAQRLQAQLAGFEAERLKLKRELDAAHVAYEDAVRPRVDIMVQALNARRYILASGADPHLIARVVETIDRDLPKLSMLPLPVLAANDEAILSIIRRATPSANVADLLTEAAGDSGLEKLYLPIWKLAKDEIYELPESKRVKAWEKHLGILDKATKLWRLATNETSDAAFGTTEIEDILLLNDLIGSMPNASAIGLDQMLAMLDVMIEDILNSVRNIKVADATTNIYALVDAVEKSSDPCKTDWLASHRLVIFGDVVMLPRIEARSSVREGSTITGRWCAPADWEGGWIGLISASDLAGVPRDIAIQERFNDEHDIEYVSLTADGVGRFDFDANLAPGVYHIRLFPSDSDGDLAIEAIIEIESAVSSGREENTGLIENGSFEEPGTFSGGWINVASANGLQGWEINSGSIDLVNRSWAPSDGLYSIDLNGYGPGAIQQDLPELVTGTEYKLTFDLAGNPECGQAEKVLTVSAGNTRYTYTYDGGGSSINSMDYVEHVFAFTAEPDGKHIAFSSDTPGACGPVLDRIWLSEN